MSGDNKVLWWSAISRGAIEFENVQSDNQNYKWSQRSRETDSRRDVSEKSAWKIITDTKQWNGTSGASEHCKFIRAIRNR